MWTRGTRMFPSVGFISFARMLTSSNKLVCKCWIHPHIHTSLLEPYLNLNLGILKYVVSSVSVFNKQLFKVFQITPLSITYVSTTGALEVNIFFHSLPHIPAWGIICMLILVREWCLYSVPTQAISVHFDMTEKQHWIGLWKRHYDCSNDSSTWICSATINILLSSQISNIHFSPHKYQTYNYLLTNTKHTLLSSQISNIQLSPYKYQTCTSLLTNIKYTLLSSQISNIYFSPTITKQTTMKTIVCVFKIAVLSAHMKIYCNDEVLNWNFRNINFQKSKVM